MMAKQFWFGFALGVAFVGIGVVGLVIYGNCRINSVLYAKTVGDKNPATVLYRNNTISNLSVYKNSIIALLPAKERLDGEKAISDLEDRQNILTRQDIGDLDWSILVFLEIRMGSTTAELTVNGERASRMVIYTIGMILKRHQSTPNRTS